MPIEVCNIMGVKEAAARYELHALLSDVQLVLTASSALPLESCFIEWSGVF
jgi:hypothetical protein